MWSDHRIRAFIIASIVLLAYTLTQTRHTSNVYDLGWHILYPVLVCTPLVLVMMSIARYANLPLRALTGYALFFSISLTSILGLTTPLNGAYAASSNLYIYGLSFYSAYLAYVIHTRKPAVLDLITATNPLLLVTGPIPWYFKPIMYTRFKRRLAYYMPFILIGIFLFKIIASPLSVFFWMIDCVDPFGAIIYALIFEIFIYANFAGLSLIIFGIFGLVGVKIPLNFRQPFSARNLIEYWRGWHTSLSMVLKTLFYRPTRAMFPAPVAILAVFLASALWHGVTLNFLLWAMVHAGAFTFTIWLLKKGWHYIATVLMLFGILYGRMLFADTDIQRLFSKLLPGTNHFNIDDFVSMPKRAFVALGLGLLLIVAEFLFARHRYFSKRNYKFLRLPYIQVMLAIVFVLLAAQPIHTEYAVYGQR